MKPKAAITKKPTGPMERTVNSSEWEWFGQAAHFICGRDCRFHLATKVGGYLVSTVGELWSCRAVREIYAESRDPKWFAKHRDLKGDFFDAEYMRRFGFEDVGCDRKYETMVFKAGEPCKRKGCRCGLPEIDGSELDFNGYNTPGDARDGHMALCRKWSIAVEAPSV